VWNLTFIYLLNDAVDGFRTVSETERKNESSSKGHIHADVETHKSGRAMIIDWLERNVLESLEGLKRDCEGFHRW